MHTFSLYPQAAAHIQGNEAAPNLSGEVQFYQGPSSTLVVANLSGLPQSDSDFFAFHIHEGTACSGSQFSATGGHYNPAGSPHPEHAGDLPPLLSCDGVAYLAVLTDRFSVRDILGRTVVIHSDPDDFHTQPAGNAGTKIACGVIRSV